MYKSVRGIGQFSVDTFTATKRLIQPISQCIGTSQDSNYDKDNNLCPGSNEIPHFSQVMKVNA